MTHINRSDVESIVTVIADERIKLALRAMRPPEDCGSEAPILAMEVEQALAALDAEPAQPAQGCARFQCVSNSHLMQSFHYPACRCRDCGHEYRDHPRGGGDAIWREPANAATSTTSTLMGAENAPVPLSTTEGAIPATASTSSSPTIAATEQPARPALPEIATVGWIDWTTRGWKYAEAVAAVHPREGTTRTLTLRSTAEAWKAEAERLDKENGEMGELFAVQQNAHKEVLRIADNRADAAEAERDALKEKLAALREQIARAIEQRAVRYSDYDSTRGTLRDAARWVREGGE